jgi:hypothetical protein
MFDTGRYYFKLKLYNMKPRLLLISLLFLCGVLSAQDTIKTMVISECRIDDDRESYAEITNMGTDTVNLSEFEFGIVGAWTVAKIDSMDPGLNFWFMLPDKKLAPGKSFVIAAVFDWTPRQWLKDPTVYNRSLNKKEMWTIADVQLHFPESPTGDPTDSVTPYYHVMETWSGRDCLYLRHHISETDSAIIDQVNGLFTDADRTNPDNGNNDVAGVTGATNNCTLVRKFSVKQGNLDFENARGQDLAESEWIPIPHQLGHWEVDADLRTLFWTVGNHGNFVLDATTLESSTVDVDFAGGILTVPWGIRNDDSIMAEFVKKPGIAWHYDYAPTHLDSSLNSARTGDTLTIYVCGDTLGKKEFRIEVAPPTTDANIVVPKYVPNSEGYFTGVQEFCVVTDGAPGMDTIMELPYACRVDTMYKYLEKAPNASWEIVWVDGQTRTDLKMGDKLKVTAENSSVKEYYIKPNPFRPSHNADLSMITWPDIPEFYKGIFGWMGDTIPNFDPNNYEYTVQVPMDVDGIPGLVAKNDDPNATYTETRAQSLLGNAAYKTVTFTSTAEDDTSVLKYTVLFDKERDPDLIQTWIAEPFFSQIIWQEQWANAFMEICNPGTEPLDLSNYMLFFGYNDDPYGAIATLSTADDTVRKYGKYIPGYKWQDNKNWEIEPGIAVQDANVNPIVYGGDVFVLGDIRGTGQSGYPWWASEQCDIDFGNNPWDEVVPNWTSLQQWDGGHFYLYKIMNDSIKEGTKPATDPNDFELIDTWGGVGTSTPTIGGKTLQQINGFVRKPQYYTGKTGLAESWGTDAASSEWVMTDRAYYDAKKVPWPDDILFVATGLGSHFMYEVTAYQSIVSSPYYRVSSGFSMDEQIEGVVTGTTAADFLGKIFKKDEGQTLTLKSGTTGADLATDAVLENGDTLVVLSAEFGNVTKYVLGVDATGLSNDATLTSTLYTISVNGSTGTVSGFAYGTNLSTVVANITVPAGATLNIVDANDAYQPMKMLNFDTVYVDVQVNDQIYFEVIAEDFVTKVLYQLKPTASASDAFVTSSVFDVDQTASVIDLVPDGITVFGFLRNLVPVTGATMQLIDKYGFDRNVGSVVKDDKLVVTAEDGVTTKIYYLTMLGESDFLAYVTSTVYSVDQLVFNITGDISETTLITAFLANLIPAKGASVKVVDAQGNAKTGDLNNGDKVVVTSGNAKTTVQYTIDVAYLAYVTSTVYTVNEGTHNISGATIKETTAVTAFLANLVPAEGATIKVVDSQGADKTGNLATGDKLVVTAGDGVTTAQYTIELTPVSVNDLSNSAIDIYPNPSSGKVYISGLELGNRIQVFNIVGDCLVNMIASHNSEIVSLENQPDGVYVIRLSNAESIVSHYRLILE